MLTADWQGGQVSSGPTKDDTTYNQLKNKLKEDSGARNPKLAVVHKLAVLQIGSLIF